MIKVADFGLAESMDTNKEYFRQNEDVIIKLPIKWLALESTMDGVFSEKSDVVRVLHSGIIISSKLRQLRKCLETTNVLLHRIMVSINHYYNNDSSHSLLISGLMVLLAGRYLVEERPHMLESILLNFLANWRRDIEWRSLSMQHAVKTCEYILLELCPE